MLWLDHTKDMGIECCIVWEDPCLPRASIIHHWTWKWPGPRSTVTKEILDHIFLIWLPILLCADSVCWILTRSGVVYYSLCLASYEVCCTRCSSDNVCMVFPSCGCVFWANWPPKIGYLIGGWMWIEFIFTVVWRMSLMSICSLLVHFACLFGTCCNRRITLSNLVWVCPDK